MEDLGLNWYAYGVRYYDPAIGRFTGVDPISDQFPWVNTYNYAENNPTTGIDLWGLQYVDANVALKMDAQPKKINVSGSMGLNIKVVNESSGSVGSGVLSFHQGKISSTFDMRNPTSFSEKLTHNVGEAQGGAEYQIGGNLYVNATLKMAKRSDVKPGDIVMILVDELKKVKNRDIQGRTVGAYIMFVEIDAFNKKDKVPTHEVGHLIGNLVHTENPNLLMTETADGQGYNLRLKEYQNILSNFVYRKGLEQKEGGNEYYNTPKEIERWWNENVKQ